MTPDVPIFGESIFGIGFADDDPPRAAMSEYRQAAGNGNGPSGPPEMTDDEYDMVWEDQARIRAERFDPRYDFD